jgi:hypothetical protein
MRPWQLRRHRLGFRLAWFALVIQALIPFLAAAEIRAAAAAEPAVIEASLCRHDGSAGAPDRAPHQDCNLACCPLCSTLAAATAFGLPGQAELRLPPLAAGAAPVRGDDQASVPPLFAGPYRSRAPPSV